MPKASYGNPTFWLTCITIDPDLHGRDRESVRLTLEDADIESRPTWKPMHLQPAFSRYPAFVTSFSRLAFERGLCLPSGHTLRQVDQQTIISLVRASGDHSGTPSA
jgi:dTDP-4-amino-4,6-dideoxygalactose transaminase